VYLSGGSIYTLSISLALHTTFPAPLVCEININNNPLERKQYRNDVVNAMTTSRAQRFIAKWDEGKKRWWYWSAYTCHLWCWSAYTCHLEDYHDAELQVRELSSMQNSLLWWNMDSIDAAS
jgi:hypothetical protein